MRHGPSGSINYLGARVKAFIASLSAGIFGIFIIEVADFYLAAMAILIALSLLTAVFSFVSAKNNRSRAVRDSLPYFVLSGVFAAGTAVAGSFRLHGLTNAMPVSAGFDLAGWLLAALLTIALSGAALVVSRSMPRGSATGDLSI